MRPRSSSRERSRSASITVYSYSFFLHRPKDLTEQDDYRRSSLDLVSHAVSSCVESHSDGSAIKLVWLIVSSSVVNLLDTEI